MSNLLLSANGWQTNPQATFDGSQWDVTVNGQYGSNPNGQIVGVGYDSAPGSILAAEASFSVIGRSYEDLWFLVVSGGGEVLFAEQIFTAYDSNPVNGTFSFSVALPDNDQPTITVSSSSTQYSAPHGYEELAAVTLVPTPVAECNYNCDCDDNYPAKTLLELRKYLMVRLGFAAMLASPPPGMTDLLNSFLIDAQLLMYRKYVVFRTERWFTWNMTAGVRFYDFAENSDVCTKHMDPRKITWVGISQDCDSWRPLHCRIEPTRYSSRGNGIPDSYEIRQCIEVWPAPVDDTWKLRIKGHFGLLPFAADADVNTIDFEVIQLHALANAKAHYGQPDAGNYMQQLATLIGDYNAGSHHTRRYIPGTTPLYPAVRPKLVD